KQVQSTLPLLALRAPIRRQLEFQTMVSNTRNVFDSQSASQTNAIAWCVAALLACALIGLIHDPNYATARGADSVEEGRGIDDKTVMDEGLAAAQTGRLIGLAMLVAAGGLCVATTPAGVRIRWDGFSLLLVAGLAWASASLLWSVDRGTTIR